MEGDANPFLSKPVTTKYCEGGEINGLQYAFCEMQGYRTEMEDKIASETMDPPMGPYSFFAVFDGHAGSRASRYCSKNLKNAIMITDEFEQLQHQNQSAQEARRLVEMGITKGFLGMDSEMCARFHRQGDVSGTTACCAIITPDMIYLANCGDSRGIVVSQEKVVIITRDHKPSDAKERDRIISAGAFVVENRINAQLAVSRALGDAEFKTMPNLKLSQQPVSPKPEIFEWLRRREDEFMVLACDGVWDVMSNEDVAKYVRKCLLAKMTLEDACRKLVDHCLKEGSKDNISVVVVVLSPSNSDNSSNSKKH